jgi:hypothetical protein
LPLVDRLDDGADVGVAGEQQADRVGVFAAELGEELDAGRLGHALVGHHAVDLVVLHDAHPLGGAGGAEDAVVKAEQVLHALDHVRLVVDDEDGVSLGHGRETFLPRRVRFPSHNRRRRDPRRGRKAHSEAQPPGRHYAAAEASPKEIGAAHVVIGRGHQI